MTFEELIQKGGPAMWPLLVLSILSLSTIIDRIWFWTSLLIKEKQTVNRVLESARRDWSIATEMARRNQKQPIGRFYTHLYDYNIQNRKYLSWHWRLLLMMSWPQCEREISYLKE